MTFDRDIIGALASWLCMVHCLAGPILLAFGMTTSGVLFFDEESVHLALIIPIIFFAAWSIPIGLKRHRKRLPSLFAVIGIVCFVSGLLIHDFETILTVMASCMLIYAHLYNKKLMKNID